MLCLRCLMPRRAPSTGRHLSFIVHHFSPIELVKVRMQMSGGGVGSTLSSILKSEGFISLWKGIQAAWGRESFCKSSPCRPFSRLSLFEKMLNPQLACKIRPLHSHIESLVWKFCCRVQTHPSRLVDMVRFEML